MVKTRRFGLMVLLCAVFWSQQRIVDTYPNDGWTYSGYGGVCAPGGGLWKEYLNHQHLCLSPSSFEQYCISECDSADWVYFCECVDNYPSAGRSEGSLTCDPGCCEANGCEQGHGGSTWSTSYCGGGNPNPPDDCGCCPQASPIIVSLQGQSITLSSPEEGVVFDFSGEGHAKLFSWPLRNDEAFLARDINRNGNIDDASELFGNATRLYSGQLAAHGYEARAELDENRDGFVDGRDSAFTSLLLWRDVQRNGRVDVGELTQAGAAGMIRISTVYRESRRVDQWGNAFRYVGDVDFREPRSGRHSVDVFLRWTEPNGN